MIKQLIDAFQVAIDSALADIHTILIARVTQINATTVNLSPVVNRVINNRSVQLTTLEEVPPIFLSGGSSYDAHPITVGDYALVLISERCFDRWYSGTDFVSPAEMRMHDLSDGFALVGIHPLASAIAIPTEVTRTGIQRIGTANPSDFAALASVVDSNFQALYDAVSGAATAPNDGGSTLKSNIIAALDGAAYPAATKSTYIKTE